MVLTKIQDTPEMEGFLNVLLTETERVMLAKRLALIVLISEGLPDSEIAQTLHVTRITVAKTRYFYEARGDGFRVALKKLEEQQQLEKFKKLLTSLARYSVKAAGGRL